MWGRREDRERLEFYRKYNKQKVKINSMGLNLRQNFDCQFRILKSPKGLPQNIFTFFFALVGGKDFFKESPSFWEGHTCTDLFWRKRGNANKDLNKFVQSKDISPQVYQI